MNESELVQTDSKQFFLKEDIPITFAEGAKMFNLNIVTLHIAAREGKLKCIQVGQGGWNCKRKYNNETTYGDLKEWRSKVRPRRKSTTINIKKEIKWYISHYTNQGQKKRA